MYLIVGLGNPERKYDNTRHNMGFEVLDALADKLGVKAAKLECRGTTCTVFYEGQKLMLAKPLTYMNLSGECIRLLTDYYNVDPATELLVIYDDVSLETGKLRIRKKGSAGGHNGIKSIISHLGSDEFWRIKVGVGAPGKKDMVSHVLGHFSAEERKVVDEAVAEAVEAALMLAGGRQDEAMNRFNRKKEEGGKAGTDASGADKAPADAAGADKAPADAAGADATVSENTEKRSASDESL